MCLQGGLPTQKEMEVSEKISSTKRGLFYYWPEEYALEVVTPERISSYKKHRDLRELYWKWRNFRMWLDERRDRRRLKQLQKDRKNSPTAVNLTPELAAPQDGFSFVNAKPSGKTTGRGLYFRLDYWAKLKGGGSYGHTCYQAKALKKVADDFICIMGSRFELLDQMGIDQIVLPPLSNLSDEYALVENGDAYEPLVEEIIKLYKPDYVLERLILGNKSVAKACKKLGVPYIAEYNGSELTMARVFGGHEMANAENLEAAEQFSFEAADIISTISEPVKDTIVARGIPADKILVNPNGVDFDDYGSLPEKQRSKLRKSMKFQANDIVIGFCATFGGWHGVEVLAEAIPQISAENKQAKFLLIGDGHFKHLVMDKVKELGIEDRVYDAGMVPQQEASDLLGCCDILLSPHSKGMGEQPFFGSPTKLFEYMAYGAGIVCSDLYQLGEVMRPGIHLSDIAGYSARTDVRSVLVRAGSVEDLVQGTLLLANDKELCDKIGANAQQAAKKFYTWDVHAQNLWLFAQDKDLVGYHIDRHVE